MGCRGTEVYPEGLEFQGLKVTLSRQLSNWVDTTLLAEKKEKSVIDYILFNLTLSVFSIRGKKHSNIPFLLKK